MDLSSDPKKLSPVLLLRIGLGLVFIYAGVHQIAQPAAWDGFVPGWIAGIINPVTFIYIHGAFELALGLGIIVGLLLPILSFIAFLDLFSIMVFFGVDDVTFRDFGLLMAALALFLFTRKEK
ncbi:DoxX family membrane protein [Patescibacteria group bacterium]|nr:DoxX family membrane protein [Patescibacteria group bacterium]